MGKKGGAKMPTYDAAAATGAQSAANQEAWQKNLQASRSNQSNPMGSMTWEQDPVTGQWTQNIKFNDQQQSNFNQQQANQGQLAGMMGSALGGYDTSQVDLSGAPAMPTVGGYNEQAIATMRALQAPQLAQQRAAQDAKLAAMGLNTGSGQAWMNAQRAIGTNENNADMQAILAGIQQGNTEFGQGMQAHNAGVQDILNQKQANLGQLSGLMGLTQSLTSPQFSNYTTPQLGTVNAMDAYNKQYDSQLAQANAKNASKSGLLGGLAGIAGSFLGPIGTAVGNSIGDYITK